MQIGVGFSKYGVVEDPLFTGHVTQPHFPAKTAYNGDVLSKLPLSFIVVPWKLYSEYANRGQGFQIRGRCRPSIYRSRDAAKFVLQDRLTMGMLISKVNYS